MLATESCRPERRASRPPHVRRMCGTATYLAHVAADVWHCHGSRASYVGCVALPRFSRTLQQMCGTATLFAHQKTGQKRRDDCGIACYTGLERCPAYSGSLVLVLAPLSLQLNSGAIYFSRNEPFASLPPHQDEPDDSDDDQEYLACRDYRLCVHGQPPFSRSCPSAAKHLVRDSSVRGRKPTGPEGPLQVNFRNREKARRTCGTATYLVLWAGLKMPKVVDRQGFEPWTLGLKVPCSAS